jgi:hypothetical protein
MVGLRPVLAFGGYVLPDEIFEYMFAVVREPGSIEVDTQPGEYTEVKIILPRAASPRMASSLCPLLALSRHSKSLDQCPLLGVKRTCARRHAMSAFDPKRTFGKLV